MSLLPMIEAYMDAVSYCLTEFETRYGRRDLLRAVVEKVIPRTGRLSGDFAYKFHGIGCRVEYGGHEVDFDFASHEGEVGFDAWRLWQFAKQWPDRYGAFCELAVVKVALAELVVAGLAAPWGGTSSLFRLTGRSRIGHA